MGRQLKIILADTRYRSALESHIRKRLPDADFAFVSPDGRIRGDPRDAEIFFAWGLEGHVVERVVKVAEKLRWFHLLSAGVESLMFPALRNSDVVITNARGIFSIPIAESVLAVLLYVAKNLKQNITNAEKRHWERLPRQELYGTTAGILGLGSIGSEIARRLACFGVHVIGLKRRPSDMPDAPVGEVFSPDQIIRFLSQSDWVIICAALTPETRKMVGREELKSMKSSAWLVNIARGEIIDERVLLEALDEAWISGACLDAFSHEPLPDDSPFWCHPKVVVTPHNSGTSNRTPERSLALALDNFDRYMKGEPLRNIVDKQAGY